MMVKKILIHMAKEVLMHNKNPIIKSFTVINTLINGTNNSTEMTLVYKNVSNDGSSVLSL